MIIIRIIIIIIMVFINHSLGKQTCNNLHGKKMNKGKRKIHKEELKTFEQQWVWLTVLSFQRQRVTFAVITKLLGTLRNNDGDGNRNGNVKKAIYVYGAKQQLCTCTVPLFFVHFLSVPAQLRHEIRKF